MKMRKSLIILFLIVLGLSLCIGAVSATAKTSHKYYTDDVGDKCLKESSKTFVKIFKENKSYYAKYKIKTKYYYVEIVDSEAEYWSLFSSKTTYKTVKVKSNQKVWTNSYDKYYKRTESKGKVYNNYKIKYKSYFGNGETKISNKITKKVYGYYKTYKMPTFRIGGYKTAYFKGQKFTYGHSQLGYYINPKSDEVMIYKVKPNTWDFLAYNFFTKPAYFKIYVLK